MNQSQQQRKEWMAEMKSESNQKLINRFNSTVHISAFGVYRSIYLSVLRNEIENRDWDYSEIIYTTPESPYSALSLSNYIYLRNNKLIKIKTHFIYNDFKIFIN